MKHAEYHNILWRTRLSATSNICTSCNNIHLKGRYTVVQSFICHLDRHILRIILLNKQSTYAIRVSSKYVSSTYFLIAVNICFVFHIFTRANLYDDNVYHLFNRRRSNPKSWLGGAFETCLFIYVLLKRKRRRLYKYTISFYA